MCVFLGLLMSVFITEGRATSELECCFDVGYNLYVCYVVSCMNREG